MVAARLNDHLNNGDLIELFQSTYRAGDNNVLRPIDDGQRVTLVFLDLSAAFFC